MTLQGKIEGIKSDICEAIEEILPEPQGLLEDVIFDAMRYSVLPGGKLLRGTLVILCCEIFSLSRESALRVACAIEILHCYSLIHDDLPMIDDDDYRRGQESCHKKFGQANALLTGDALLTYAFEILSDPLTHSDGTIRANLVSCLARASGTKGLIGGQVIDIIGESRALDHNEINRMQRMKTGALFLAACDMSAILCYAQQSSRNALRAYAVTLGVAFQVQDDILDAKEESDNKGVPFAKKNSTETKKSLLTKIVSEKEARHHCHMLLDQAISHLSIFGSSAKDLIAFTKQIIKI